MLVAAAGPALAADETRIVTVATAPALDGSPTGWATATHAHTAWDFTHGRAASEPVDVAFETDGTQLYLRFDVPQREPIVATQAVDTVGEGSDDDVTVRLAPGGPNGFVYDFRATPRGTRYQASSENTIYTPGWTAHAMTTATGYVVTMAIPLRVMRTDGRSSWRMQFERDIKTLNERDEWARGDGQTTTDQFAYEREVGGFAFAAHAAHTAPRIGVYALGQAGAPAAGGWTSRTGADLAVPITATTSLVATIHPDFSNVETDQATIAPTTFARNYTEVRPFFAQGAHFYDYTSCYGCPGFSELYTPAIPTPRRGFQLEGTNGSFTFGALDAVGSGRVDDAQSLAWVKPDNTLTLNYTRVASEQTLVHDVVDFGSLQYNSQHGVVGYLETGSETGTNVLDNRRARRFDGGIAYQTRDDFDAFTTRSVGSQWNPVDGYTAVNDIGGYSAQLNHTFHVKHGAVQSVAFFEYIDHYSGSDGFGTNLFDTESQVTVVLAKQFQAQANIGTTFYRVPGDPALHPANFQGARFDYRINTPLQSTFNYQAGRYGDGWLIAVDRIAGLRLMRRATLSLEAYSTTWHGPATNTQWLDRANLTFDIDRQTSFTVGVRKLIGTAPPFPGQALPLDLNATNVTLAIARRRPRDEVYVVYGDPSAVSTVPALIVKYVHYFGAEKGT